MGTKKNYLCPDCRKQSMAIPCEHCKKEISCTVEQAAHSINKENPVLPRFCTVCAAEHSFQGEEVTRPVTDADRAYLQAKCEASPIPFSPFHPVVAPKKPTTTLSQEETQPLPPQKENPSPHKGFWERLINWRQ